MAGTSVLFTETYLCVARIVKMTSPKSSIRPMTAMAGFAAAVSVISATSASALTSVPSFRRRCIIKQDGTREEFDREKLARGIRISCAKRPVSAADIERLIGQVESELQKMGKAEVSSRVIGDMVINGLKELDQIAYIRYAIVYLRLQDLHALRSEIDRLLEG